MSASRILPLKDILPEAGMEELGRLLLHTPQPSIVHLKALTNKYKTSLLEKEVDADYLAYWLFARLSFGSEEPAQD
jgi:hypothetical protein